MEESDHTVANTSVVHSDDTHHPTSTAETPAAPVAPVRPAKLPTVGELRRERKRLWDTRELAVYHVGGLAVDLCRRGLDDPDLVSRRAEAVLAIDARLNEVDAILGQVDGRRRGGPAIPAAGYCMSCGAPFQHEATFCSRCGARVMVPDEAEPAPVAGDQPTVILGTSEVRRP
jgi:hypothetical protein